MKTKLLVATLIAGSSLFAETHVSIGIGIGDHGYAAPSVVAYRPHSPGPDYVWVDGYWDRVGPRRFWREGYWAHRRYGRDFRMAPRYDRDRYWNGYNQGGNGVNSNHGNFRGPDSQENRSGNFFSGNGNSANGGTFFNGTNGTGYNGNGDRRFNNPNGRR